MADLGLRLPPNVHANLVKRRPFFGGSLQTLFERSIDLAEEETADFQRYLLSYNTNGGRKRRRGGTLVLNTSISDTSFKKLQRLPRGSATQAEALGACIRHLLDLFVGSVFLPDHKDLQDVPLEVTYPIRRLTLPDFVDRESLAAIKNGSAVMIDANILVLARCRTESGRDCYGSTNLFVSRECRALLHRVQSGEIEGYTTTSQLKIAFNTIASLESSLWESSYRAVNPKHEHEKPKLPKKLRIGTFDRRETKDKKRAQQKEWNKRVSQAMSYWPSPERRWFFSFDTTHPQRVRKLVPSLIKSGVKVVPETPTMLLQAMATSDPASLERFSFLAAFRTLDPELRVMATADRELSKDTEERVYTPSDLPEGDAVECDYPSHFPGRETAKRVLATEVKMRGVIWEMPEPEEV